MNEPPLYKAAIKWCDLDENQESRPVLTRMVRRLATDNLMLRETLTQVQRILTEDPLRSAVDNEQKALVLIRATFHLIDHLDRPSS